MGTSSTPAQLAGKLDAYAASVAQVDKKATDRAAATVKASVVPLMRAATGGDMELSGTSRTTGTKAKARNRGRKIGVRYKVKELGGVTSAIVGATGPAHLVEDDVPKHYVFSRYARAGGVKARTRRAIVDGRKVRIDTRSAAQSFGVATVGGVRAVLHWGADQYRRWTIASSRGRKPWARGVKAARPIITRQWSAEHRRNLDAHFR